QTVALTLAHLPATRLRNIFMRLDPAWHTDLLMRIATLDHVDAQILAKLNESIEHEAAQSARRGPLVGGVEKVAAMINSLDHEQGQKLIEQLSVQDPNLAEEVKKSMFRYDDIQRLDSKNLRTLLQ